MSAVIEDKQMLLRLKTRYSLTTKFDLLALESGGKGRGNVWLQVTGCPLSINEQI
jgi:hypothetical protein